METKHIVMWSLLRRRRANAGKRGVTLVEVLIVLAIMALIAGSAVFVVIPQLAKARVETAVLSAQTIKKAAELHMNLDGEGCPTVQDLVNGKKLEKGKTDDPWGTPFKIDCKEGNDVVVTSAGKDKKEGTADDIRDDFKKSDIKRIADM